MFLRSAQLHNTYVKRSIDEPKRVGPGGTLTVTATPAQMPLDQHLPNRLLLLPHCTHNIIAGAVLPAVQAACQPTVTYLVVLQALLAMGKPPRGGYGVPRTSGPKLPPLESVHAGTCQPH